MSTTKSRAEELERTIAGLRLAPYIKELDEQGYTVVPPDITGVTDAQINELTQLLLDESEKYVRSQARRTGTVRCKFTVADGPECELDYGDYQGNLEQASGVKPSKIQLVQLCNIHRAFRDLAVNPAGTSIIHHLIGSHSEFWAARFSSFNAFIKWQGEGYGESLGLHCDQGLVPLPWGEKALNANCTWALTDYTREGGALACVPGSHRRGSHPGPDAAQEAIPVECPRGSLIAFHGALWRLSEVYTRVARHHRQLLPALFHPAPGRYPQPFPKRTGRRLRRSGNLQRTGGVRYTLSIRRPAVPPRRKGRLLADQG